MVLPFQAHEVACHDVHEAQLPAVLIDVEVRHRPHDSASGVKDALLAHFVLGWSGMLVMFQPDQSHGFSFPSGACVPEHLYYHHLGTTVLEGPYSPECMEGSGTSALRSSPKFVRMLRIRTKGALRPGCHRSGRGLHFLCLVPQRTTGGEWFVTNDGIEHSSSRPLALGVR